MTEPSILYRETGSDDLETLVSMRIKFILDLHPVDDAVLINEAARITREYFIRAVQEKEYIGFIGTLREEPVCCAGVLLYRLPPLIHSLDRLQGHVLNFFTCPGYRGRGYGSGLLKYVIDAAGRRNINRLFLNATEAGEPLYRKFGFSEQREKALILTL